MSVRQGPGVKRGWEPSPALVAERLARMNAGKQTKREERRAKQRELVEELSGMPLEALARGVTTRQWTVAIMHLGGYGVTEIAQALGYATVDGINRVLRHPAVRRVIELVRQAQLDRVLQGTFGVQAQAKAAAPEVMAHVSELAGARKTRDGERVGRARRDSDTLRAAELVLTVSGDKVERKAVLHAHIFEQMTDVELETLATRAEWPERFRGVAGYLPSGGEE